MKPARLRIRERVSGAVFAVEQGSALLPAMEAARCQAIAVGCRNGGCGVCKVRVLQGDFDVGPMSRRHVSAAEQADGLALACRLYPRTDMEIERILEPVARKH
ncbi:2Fe-2S iron-sulfur cluster-binding protein [Pseudomonas sp. GCM10022188]|uniref:2Fe-2S iron-sulfur cluster-binding protein n=1 Tax=Pseudomonas TaxID=286 RepID=UPI001E3A7A4F|nr:2Fe-2S iron-sulfur cluster-binding protein [Pseudomonas oryzagri]MCC6073953.1 2Fe-2S iron-sulfur cluster-binding protein [Pseudomonas oryzagri]